MQSLNCLETNPVQVKKQKRKRIKTYELNEQ